MSRLIRLAEVQHRTGYAKSSIYRMVKQQEFPAPVKIGERASAWVEAEIQDWIEARILARNTETNSVLGAESSCA